jgi:hypothetical protein
VDKEAVDRQQKEWQSYSAVARVELAIAGLPQGVLHIEY